MAPQRKKPVAGKKFGNSFFCAKNFPRTFSFSSEDPPKKFGGDVWLSSFFMYPIGYKMHFFTPTDDINILVHAKILSIPSSVWIGDNTALITGGVVWEGQGWTLLLLEKRRFFLMHALGP